MVFDLIGGGIQKRSFLVLKEGGRLVAATQPVSQEETAMHRVSDVMMRLAPSKMRPRLGRTRKSHGKIVLRVAQTSPASDNLRSL